MTGRGLGTTPSVGRRAVPVPRKTVTARRNMMYLDFASTIYLPVAFMAVMTACFAGVIMLFMGLTAWEARRPNPQPIPVKRDPSH